MKKVKQNIVVIILIFVIISFMINSTYANTLNIELNSNKQNVKIEENVTITVDWKEKMQAADYILEYDETKLEYVSASIEDIYINKTQEGQIGISWFSTDNKDLTKMTFTFKAKEAGETQIVAQIDCGFADGQLKQPDSYDTKEKGQVTLKITKQINSTVMYALIICVVLSIFVIIIEVVHKKNKNKRGEN